MYKKDLVENRDADEHGHFLHLLSISFKIKLPSWNSIPTAPGTDNLHFFKEHHY